MAESKKNEFTDAFSDMFSNSSLFGGNKASAPKPQQVYNVTLNNAAYRKLLRGEYAEFLIGTNRIILILPADVRDVVHRTENLSKKEKS